MKDLYLVTMFDQSDMDSWKKRWKDRRETGEVFIELQVHFQFE